MFNTIAHCSTAYYYFHVLSHIAGMGKTLADPVDPILRDFLDLRPKFYTMWGLAAQFLLFALCVVHDLTRLFPASSPVRRAARGARDIVLVALAGPVAVNVSLMFWSLFWADRQLVMPAALDAAVPPWLNHAMHSFIVVLVAVQLLAEPHHAPPLRASFAVAITLAVAYMYTLFGEYAATGRWMYPVFDKLNWAGRLALLGVNVGLYLGLVVLFTAAVRARWGPAADPKNGTKKCKD